MSSEKVVIGIVPRDRFSMFRPCLEALYAHTDLPFRVVVVAGGADGATRQYLQKLQAQKDNLTVVLVDRFLMQGEARNLALRQIQDRFVVVLENDTIVHKHWLRPLLDCRQEEGAAVVAPLILSRWSRRIHAAGGVFEEREKDGAVEFHHQMVYAEMKIASVPLQRTRIAYPESHCVLIDRQLLPDNDLFDDAEPFDADLGLTLRKRGLTAFLEPRSVATYAEPPPLAVCDVGAFKFRWDAETWPARNHRFMQKWALTYDGSQKQLFYRRQHRKLGLARWYPNKFTVWMYNMYLGPLARLRRSAIVHLLLDSVSSLRSQNVSGSAVSERLATGAHSHIVSTSGEEMLHVLIVSNHWEAQKKSPSAAIYVDRQAGSLRDIGVQISTFDIGTTHSPLHIFHQWLDLRRQVRRLNPHLIHGQYGTIVGIVSVFAGRPTVLSFCGGDLLPGASVSALRMCFGFLLSNLAALRARRLICKSEGLRHALWWRRNQAVVIPNGVDLKLFTPGPRDEARKELGWDTKRPMILINGAGDPQAKGVDLAEAAMAVTRSHVPEAELYILTDVEPNHMYLYHRAADIFLCASKPCEGSPNAVKEALACNLPIVSTPVGDVPERLADVYPSAIVPRDANAIGEALVSMLRLRTRSNGREHIVHLSLDQVAQQVLAVYRLAAAPARKPTVRAPR